MANVIKIRFNTIYDLFVADLDNGGIRVGMLGAECFDFPPSHPNFQEVNALTPDTTEEFYDERYAKYAAPYYVKF